MSKPIFRKKSMERLSSPDQLNDYLRVTNPVIWVVLAVLAALIAAFFLWAHLMSVESYASGKGVVSKGVMTISFQDGDAAGMVEPGMTVTVGELETKIASTGTDEGGELIAVAEADVPDGTYEVKVRYKSTKILKFLLD